MPLITPTSAAQNDLAQQKKNEYVIHAVGTAAQPTHVLGQFAAKKLGLKRVAMIADDFAYGHEGAAGFFKAYEDNGGRAVQRLWPPLNVPDYGNYIAQIKPDVDGGVRRLRGHQRRALPEAIQGVPAETDGARQPHRTWTKAS